MVLWSDKTITELFDDKQWGWVNNLMKKNKTKHPIPKDLGEMSQDILYHDLHEVPGDLNF